MALSACRECGQQVSTDAPRCPSCGTSRPAKAEAAWSWPHRIGVAVVLLGCLWLVVLIASEAGR